MRNPIREVLAEKGADLYTITPQATVTDAVKLMNEKRIGALLVVQEERLVGIFSERDLLRRVVDPGLDPKTTRMEEVMTPDVLAVHPDATVEDAMFVMSEQKFRHAPVLEDDRLLGMLSMTDLMRWMVRAEQKQIDELVRYISGSY